MFRSPQHRILSIILLLTLILGGCSAFIYERLDGIITGRIDGYFRLPSRRKQILQKRIKGHLTWLRQDGFTPVITFLEKSAGLLEQGIDDTGMAWMENTVNTIQNRLFSRILPDMSWFLSGIKEQQINHFARRVKQDNRKLEELAKLKPEERCKRRFQRFLDALQKWTGGLEHTQKQTLRRHFRRTMPDNTQLELRLAYWRQARMIRLMRSDHSAQELETILRARFTEENGNIPDWYRDSAARQQRARWQMLRVVDKLINKKQRRHAAKRCRDYARQLRDLMK